MAGADTHKRVFKLEQVEVPDWMIKGNKFIKWEEESNTATPVTLRVDEHGHFLYWKNQVKDTDCLELTTLRDTRCGEYANVPKDGKLRESCIMGSPEIPLEEKTLTIVYGADMIGNNTLNFCSNSEKIAQDWADMVLKISYQRSAQYPSPYKLLEKIYTKLAILVNKEGKIPIKGIKRMFASSREDKKKVENALQAAGVHIDKKDDSITPSSFRIEDFFTFYTRLISQKEIDKVFQGLGAKNKPYLTTQQVITFLNQEQRDPRLNEILYPFSDAAHAKELINRFEPNKAFMRKGQLSVDGLLRYLLSDVNSVVGPNAYLLCQDMEQPLAHYFINSSHNTYLTGHQFTGKSSVEMYRQTLLSGCRCVELDCWDGKTTEEEPVITHGYTMCTEVSFKEVIEAIKETAFKTTDFPVILSFENHCSQKQQAKMANYCRMIFGDALLVDPLEENKIEAGSPLPSPNALRGKILVKNKKRKVIEGGKKRTGQKKNSKEGERKVSVGSNKVRRESQSQNPHVDGEVSAKRRESQISKRSSVDNTNGEEGLRVTRSRRVGQFQCPVIEGPVGQAPQFNKIKDSPSSSPKLLKKVPKDEGANDKESSTPVSQDTPARRASTPAMKTLSTDSERSQDSNTNRSMTETLDEVEEESDSDDDEENMSKEEAQRHQMEKREKGTAGKEAEAGREMSALVNYIQPVHFHTFEAAEKKNRSYEISSFVETSAMNRVKENPIQFCNYNKRQLSRIYPRGTRVDSSNYMPQIFWNVGCQMVALNYQTLDLPMQLNMGYFEINGRTGYILKPEFMRRKDRLFDPFAESTMDAVVAATVEVKVISGQFLSDRRVNTYVEVDMFGLPADTVRRRYKTKSQTSNSINPIFDGNPFVFKKVIMPELAMLRIAVFEDSGKMVGHRILPVQSLRPGYRHIFLCNESNQPLMLPTLFLNIKVRDYVPERMTNFADALANPIAYQSKVEKRAAQLKALEEVEEVRQVKAPAEAEAKEKDLENGEDNEEKEVPEVQSKVVVAAAAAAAAPAPPSVETANAPSGTYRKNTPNPTPTPEPNGLKTNSKPAITPSSSLGDSMAIPRSKSLGTAQFMVESMGPPLTQNNRSISAPNLGQSEEIQAARLEDIKEHKKYKKVAARLGLELEKLIKKQEKKQSKMKRTQEKERAKMTKSHQKAFKNLSKKQSGQMKKAAKKGQNLDELRQQLNDVMEALKRDKENEMTMKQAAQETALIELYKRHFAVERDLKKEHAEIMYELQMELMVAVHEKQLSKLDGQHKKEEVDLRKRMDEKNAEDLKQMSKRRGDKQELSRLRRENQQKFIQQAVNSRQTLHEIQQKKRDELEQQMKELQEELAVEEDTHAVTLDEEYEAKCRQLLIDSKSNKVPSETPVITAHSNGVAAGQEQQVATQNGDVEVEAVIETNAKENSEATRAPDQPVPQKLVQTSSSSSQGTSEDQGSSEPHADSSTPPSPTKSTKSSPGGSPRRAASTPPDGSPKKSPAEAAEGPLSNHALTTPEGSPKKTPVGTPEGSPQRTAVSTPPESPKKTPVSTPQGSPGKKAVPTPQGLPKKSPVPTPEGSPRKTADAENSSSPSPRGSGVEPSKKLKVSWPPVRDPATEDAVQTNGTVSHLPGSSTPLINGEDQSTKL